MTAAASPANDLMPVPAQLQWVTASARDRHLASRDLRFHRRRAPARRSRTFLRRAQERTGLTFPHRPTGGFVIERKQATAAVVIECAAPGAAVPVLAKTNPMA